MMYKTTIIAEAGVNHNGDLEKAKKLIDVAANAGADYVKFQSFKADKLVSPSAKKAEYQKVSINDGDDRQYAMLKRLELSNDDHLELINYSKKASIKFLSTAFDVEGLNYLNNLNLDLFKIPSGEITNYPYLKKISEFGKRAVLSTGMSNMNEIKQALQVLTSSNLKRDQVIVLHCNTQYPTPMQDVNLRAMNYIAEELGVKVGYSDHTLGIEVPIAAVALGACVIEKHFTLDRKMKGPDHSASLEPDELKSMINLIRSIELSIKGDGIKKPSESELKNRDIARKSIHLSTNVIKGKTIEEADIIALRPGDGISPMDWKRVIGKKYSKNLEKHHKLTEGDFE